MISTNNWDCIIIKYCIICLNFWQMTSSEKSIQRWMKVNWRLLPQNYINNNLDFVILEGGTIQCCKVLSFVKLARYTILYTISITSNYRYRTYSLDVTHSKCTRRQILGKWVQVRVWVGVYECVISRMTAG